MKGYLSFNDDGTARVIVQGMPICSDRTIAEAKYSAAWMKVELEPHAWNGDRGEWVWLSTIED